jgi:alpha-N-arabinofuranosidase
MAKAAKITVHPDFRIGPVDKRLYGAFLEPIRNWVYGAVWNPRHPQADDMGFRKDVLALIREFGLSQVRLPGGNWTSGWEWENSIGPLSERKAQLDLAWRQIEPNTIGHDEYIEWSRRAGVDPVYTLNLGSAGLTSAFHCVDYSLNPGGSYWSELRKQYGHRDPYPIKTWCLGNEMDGPWQIASWEKDPRGYGVKAHEIAKIIKWINPSCETVVCGSCSPHTATYPKWDMDVLEECYESVDYVSVHHYYNAPLGDIDSFLNASQSFEDFIKTTLASCDHMKTRKRSRKTMMIAFDEYSAHQAVEAEPVYWYDARRESIMEFGKNHLAQPFRRYDDCVYPGGERRPPSSEMLDALALNSIAMTLLRHADRIKLGCLTGFIQGALRIDADHAWKSAVYYAYEQLNKYGQGLSLMPVIDGPVHDVGQTKTDWWHENPSCEGVQLIEGAAALDEEKGEAAVFFINKDQHNDIPVDLDLRAFEGYKLREHTEMYSEDPGACNSFANQEVIKPRAVSATKLEGGRISALAKKLSWNCIRLKKQGA